jgi:hypothetical protein
VRRNSSIFFKSYTKAIIMPDAVWREVTAACGSLPGAQACVRAHQQGWLTVQTPGNHSLITHLKITLDAGEAQAIALAAELGASLLLMDETEGRAAAQTLGLAVTGTLGVLLRAKRVGKLTALKPIVDALMQQHSFRLSGSVYEQFLRQAGETP